jgi:CO/xanthine dehydrogenase FAD-binding subunit
MSLYPLFARPRTVQQAAQVLESMSSGVVVIAGGQELMPHVNHGVLQPEVYVDINALADLKGIREDDGLVSIGALTVHRDTFSDPLVAEKLPLLVEAMKLIGGGRQVHNRATMGGNIVAMHPLYDVVPVLLTLEAQVEVVRGAETRRTSLKELMADPRHGLGSEAILIRVLVAPMAADAGFAYEKLKSSGGAYGSANAAVALTVADGVIASLRLVIGAVADRLVDASEALAFCIGQSWSDALASKVEHCCAGLIDQPLSDHQGDGEWRKAMAGVVAQRAMGRAVARAVAQEGR